MRFCAAAAPHMKPVNCRAVLERRLGETARVPGITGTLQPMHDHKMPLACSFRLLYMHEHTNAGLRFMKHSADGKARGIERPIPVVRRNGLQVRTTEQRLKREQLTRFYRARNVVAETA